MVIAGKMNRWL